MDITIFGVSGDLAEKKLIPALTNLYEKKRLPGDVRVIGFSRSEKHHHLPFEYIHVKGNYHDHGHFVALKAKLRPDLPHLFYIALPPDAARDALRSLVASGLVKKSDAPGSRIVLLEKPHGNGYMDAASLIDFINESFSPGQCLKVDHYAGKIELREGVRDRLGSKAVSDIEILETSTVENRGGFYDNVGALRDIGQNHLLFMLATALKGDGKREDVLAALEVDPDSTKYHFGHYEGYDKIETFFSIPVRYKGQDIMLRSGKGLSRNVAIICNVDGTNITLSSGTSAYENILTDAIDGCHQTFLSDKEVLLAWDFIEKIEHIKAQAFKQGRFFSYPLGSDADEII